MAEFNPKTADIGTPNSTGVSKLGKADSTFENLFSGIGDVLGKAVKTGDAFVTNTIEDNARDRVERVTQEMGLLAAGQGAVPQELSQTQDSLKRLTLAQVQGRVTPEYYYQRLAATMKGLRAKYPGYEKEVDQIVTQVTGRNPANTFRDLLLQNINQVQSELSSKANKVETFVQNNSKYLNTDEIQDPAKYGGVDGLALKIRERQSREYQDEAERAKAARDSSRAKETLATQLNRKSVAVISQVADAAGMGGTDFSKILLDAGKSGGIDPQRLDQMKAGLDTQIIKTRTELLGLTAHEGFSTIPATEKNAQIEAAIQPLKDLRALLDAKNYDGAAQLVARNKAKEDEALNRMYTNMPALAGAKAISSVNPEIGATMINDLIKNGFNSNLDFIKSVTAGDTVRSVVRGDTSLSDAANEIASNPRMSAAERSQMLTGILNGTIQVAAKVPQTPEEVEAFVQKNYTLGAANDQLWQNVQSDQRLSLFGKLFSPEITKKIAASGSSRALQQYQDAAVDRFQSVPEFRAAAADVTNTLQGLEKIKAEYNPATNRIEFQLTGEPSKGFFGDAEERNQLRRLGQFVTRFNQGLSVIAPIIEASGMDETKGIQRLLQEMNVNLEGGRREGIFSRISGLLDSARETAKEGAPPEAGDIIAGEIPGIPELTEVRLQELKNSPEVMGTQSPDALKNIIGRAEGTDKARGYNETLDYGKWTDGPVNLVGMTLNEVDQLQTSMLRKPGNNYGGRGSSAVGRYQITRETLRDFRNQLGLKGTEKFDEKMQDKLADAIIESSGYSKWKSGQMSDAQFLSKLGGRWASLPGGSGRRGAGRAEVLNAAQNRAPAANAEASKGNVTTFPDGATETRSGNTITREFTQDGQRMVTKKVGNADWSTPVPVGP